MSNGEESVTSLLPPAEDDRDRKSEELPYSSYSDLESIHDPMLWAEGYYFDLNYDKSSFSERDFEFYHSQEQEGEEAYFVCAGEEEAEDDSSPEVAEPSTQKQPKQHKFASDADGEVITRRKSLFVHSSPLYFPDVNRARKSVFGSVFLRTTGHAAEDLVLLRSVAESSYGALQSLLTSFERILSSPGYEIQNRQTMTGFKESLMKVLESHGVSRTYSEGSVYWNIYPIARSLMFSLQIGEQIHQTRFLSRIEDRIIKGPIPKLRLPYEWPTDSVWTGYWDTLGMTGVGTYNMPHGVTYNGKMLDGMFHDNDASLTYPNQMKALHCVFDKGRLLDCQFQFPDLLMHEKENWTYCQFPDRRFWNEVARGLKPAKIAQKTEEDPPRHIPPGSYDTGDGFYDPVSLMLISPAGELLRVPVCSENDWIKKYCRKGFFEHADFRPDFFENWYDFDYKLINSILQRQSDFRTGKISYRELQQFYADQNLLPSWSEFKKRKSPSEMAMETPKSVPSPMPLRREEKSDDHMFTSAVLAELKSGSVKSQQKNSASGQEKSKSTFSETDQEGEAFILEKTSHRQTENESFFEVTKKRKIPEKFMAYQPVLKYPFETHKAYTLADEWNKKKTEKSCPGLSRMSSPLSWSTGSETTDSKTAMREHKSLRKFMKGMIMDVVTTILIEEKERHKKRLQWAKKPSQKVKPSKKKVVDEETEAVLNELYRSIPTRSEFCDTHPGKSPDLREFAEDKYESVQYWGKRIFMLQFDETSDQ